MTLTAEELAKYTPALSDVDLINGFSMTTTGNDNSYTWQSANKHRNYTLSKSEVWEERTAAEGSSKFVPKWSFSAQERVSAAYMAAVSVTLTVEELAKYTPALLDVDLINGFSMTTIGKDNSYTWQSDNKHTNYTLSKSEVWEERTAAEGGSKFVPKWSFSAQERVSAASMAAVSVTLTAEELAKYSSSLPDVDFINGFSMTTMGNDNSYTWQSANKKTNYTLAQAEVWEERTVAEGGSTFVPKWSFSAQQRVSAAYMAAESVTLTAEELAKYTPALGDVDSVSGFSMTTNGNDVSCSWQSANKHTSYTLSQSEVWEERTTAEGGSKLVPKWSFSAQQRVSSAYMAAVSVTLTAEELAKYTPALGDVDLISGFSMTTTGKDNSYTWQSANK